MPIERSVAGAGIALLGRILFSSIFILASFGDFSSKGIGEAARHGVPMPSLLVPLAGVLTLVSGLSIVLGYRARWGAWGVVVFLAIITPVMHNFWAVTDANTAAMEMAQFMKNVAMLGAALMIAYQGSGPLSLDSRRR
jgi:putative oxidoreductase